MKRLLIGLGVIAFLLPQYCEGSPIDEKINIVIKETLIELEPYVPNNIATQTLLQLTAAVESDNGRNTKNNSSIGVWQLTESTIKYVQKWLCKQSGLCKKVDRLKTKSTLHYHAALAIIYYGTRIDLFNLYITDKLDNIDIFTLAVIWKNEYNTYKGSGNYFDAYRKFKVHYRKEIV